MKILSVNLNKRMRNQGAGEELRGWLDRHSCDVLLVQEPWSKTYSESLELPGYSTIGGTSSVYSWIRPHISVDSSTLQNFAWQELRIGFLKIWNIYLSAYSAPDRVVMYRQLSESLRQAPDEPTIILGDFNTAPNPCDGLYAGEISTWTKEPEREELRSLLASANLVDLTSASRLGRQEYTIERTVRGKVSTFRCDLALASDFLAVDITACYDHSVRRSPCRITDHSAVVLDIPLTTDLPNTLPFVELPQIYAPHKTAMARDAASTIAREFIQRRFNVLLAINNVLDFGCGRGQDVRFYLENGLTAEGFDPYPTFGWTQRPSSVFDIVTVVFVLNVLPTPQERIAVLRDAFTYVRPGGYMLVATRSKQAIAREVVSKNWPPHNDGYWSHEGKGTFQKGIGDEELRLYLNRIGLKSLDFEIIKRGDITCVVGQRPDITPR